MTYHLLLKLQESNIDFYMYWARMVSKFIFRDKYKINCFKNIKIKNNHQVETSFDLGKYFIDPTVLLNKLTDKIPFNTITI